MRILFMGTPDIAATVLKTLVDDAHNIVAVVTGEDKIRGRGNKVTPTPTKLYAQSVGIDVYTPATLRDESFNELLENIAPDMIVVVAYGKILPESVINFPKYGCINMHVSLLPKYRGAAPMQRAIMDGEKTTGVTVMYMDKGLDTGDIIACDEFDILPTDDFEAIHDRSAERGGRLLSQTIRDIFAGTATRTRQDGTLASYAKKVEREDARIDFTLSAERLDCIIRGVTPIPGAFCYHNSQMLKICKARPVPYSSDKAVGTVVELDSKADGSICVVCAEGALLITALKPEGKGVMSAGDYIRGRKIALGDILT